MVVFGSSRGPLLLRGKSKHTIISSHSGAKGPLVRGDFIILPTRKTHLYWAFQDLVSPTNRDAG